MKKKSNISKRLKQSPILKKLIPKLVGMGLNVLSIFQPRKAAKIAMDIFMTPRKGKIQNWHKKFLNNFSQKPLDMEGIKVATYHGGGSGKTILFCHGWESNAFRWRKIIRHLKDKNYHFVMMDAPAHGESGSKKFDALLYSRMIDTVSRHYRPDVIIGHSVGGFASFLYLSKYQPDWVKKLIILASPDRLETITDTYFSMLGMNKRIRKYYEKLVIKRFGAPTSSFNASDFVKNIDLPGIIIHDEKDDTNYYWEGQEIIRHWQKGKLYTVHNLGHGLQGKEVFEIVAKELVDCPE